MSLPSFAPFPILPPELRRNIWQEALLEYIKPAFYGWERDLWQPQHDLSDRLSSSSDDANTCPVLRYRHDLLKGISIKIPLAYVNHEARSETMLAVREHNISITYSQADEETRLAVIKHNTSIGHSPPDEIFEPVFVRPFNPEMDVLTVHFHGFPPFFHSEVLGAMESMYPDEEEIDYQSAIKFIALGEPHLQCEHTNMGQGLMQALEFHENIRVLYIIIGGDWKNRFDQAGDIGPDVGTYCWMADAGRFNFESAGLAGDTALKRMSIVHPHHGCAESARDCTHLERIEKAIERIATAFTEQRMKEFTIRIVLNTYTDSVILRPPWLDSDPD
ncbi:hypothetical protein K461DRAFT_271998 [Myriangium duriaei CBS 260.36]|uniref:2EXR domain-containing protein n=1 Tax=Myriangium duriaei CBS 260.36 TaxID=1168546 RepID=A0A9P4MCS6_9PEZI|nr:hypothetical protein K461DRAFT_271998 [Myriangium duriaei CBS 260.36]